MISHISSSEVNQYKRKLKVNQKILQVYNVCDKLKLRQGKIIAESRA